MSINYATNDLVIEEHTGVADLLLANNAEIAIIWKNPCFLGWFLICADVCSIQRAFYGGQSDQSPTRLGARI